MTIGIFCFTWYPSLYIYIYISYKTARVVGLTPSVKSHGRGLTNPLKLTVYN